MAVYEHTVRFDEVDAAGVAFFPYFFGWCHEAMAAFFGAVPGGYVDLITKRRIGFPAVHVEADWKTPVNYGDTVRIKTSVKKVGATSVTFEYVLERASDGVYLATIRHVAVATNLDTMTKVAIPDDCRALCEAAQDL